MANKKISGYTEKTALDTTDLFLIEQASGTYRKATSTAIKQTAGMISNSSGTGSVTTTDLYNVIGSLSSTASGNYSTVIGSATSTASGSYSSTVMGSYNSIASGANYSTVIGSGSSTASGTYSTVIGSDTSTASGTYSTVIGSAISTANGDSSTVIGSGGSTASGANYSTVIGSAISTANGDCSTVIGSAISTANGVGSTVIGSDTSTASGNYSTVIGSYKSINSINFSLAMGYAVSGSASTANRKIHLFGETGNISIAGTLSSSVTFTDFAEMFKNNQGEEIEAGYIVTLDGDGVRIATEGDDISGVVSYTAVVLAGDTPFCWAGRYLYDEFGRPVMEEINDPERGRITVQKENPDYNPELEQIPRIERPLEYTPVGLIGQVLVRVSESVIEGDKLSALNGIGIKSETKTGLKCMKITVPYDSEKGYAVARCLINVSV